MRSSIRQVPSNGQVDQHTVSLGTVLIEPGENVIDWKQCAALLRLLMLQVVRPNPGVKSTFGRNPLVQLAFSQALMGLVFSTNYRLCQDAFTYLSLVFTTALTMAALVIIPDSYDVRQRTAELLGSKPISHKTLATARTGMLLLYAVLNVCCFSAAPLITARGVFGSSWTIVVGSIFMLVAGAFSLTVLWLHAMLFMSTLVGLDRLRSIAQLVLVVAYMGTLVTSAAVNAWHWSSQLSISLSEYRLIRLWPPVWFSSFLSDDFSVAANFERAGVVALVGVGLWVALKLNLGKSYPQMVEKLSQPDDIPTSRPLSVRALDLIRQIPALGERLVSSQAFAAASIIMTVARRDEISRLKTVAPATMLILSFVALFVDTRYALLLVTYSGFISVVEGLNSVRGSSQPGASWLFHAAPLDLRELNKGIRLVIGIRYFALAAALSTICWFLSHPPLQAFIMSIGYFFVASLLVSLQLAMTPAMPLSREILRSSALSNIVLISLVHVSSVTGYIVLELMMNLFGMAGLVIAIAAVACLAIMSYLCKRWSVERLARLEAY